MKKGAKIFIWILVVAVIILIIYIIVTANKKTSPTPKPPTIDPATGDITYNTEASKAGIDISKPASKVETTQFNLNDTIYAGEDTLNTYKSCSPGVNNIAYTWNKGDLIGKFIRKEGNCIVVTGSKVINLPFGTYIPIGTTDYYLPFNANVYKL